MGQIFRELNQVIPSILPDGFGNSITFGVFLSVIQTTVRHQNNV